MEKENRWTQADVTVKAEDILSGAAQLSVECIDILDHIIVLVIVQIVFVYHWMVVEDVLAKLFESDVSLALKSLEVLRLDLLSIFPNLFLNINLRFLSLQI